MKTKYLLILLSTLLFTACNSTKSANYSEPTTYASPNAYQETRATAMTPQTVMTPRKVAMSANIDVEVDNINDAEKELTSLIESFSGHIENARLSENGHYYANIKVPSNKLTSVLDAIAKLGEKTSQSINKRDITAHFVNNEERLKNLKIFREKMKTLLNKTSNIEEILRIERELNRVQTEIDTIERQLKNMQGSVDMSPIDVNLEEKTIYGPVGYVGNGIWWVVKKLFVIR
jgi:valyl-tRNA synthetase